MNPVDPEIQSTQDPNNQPNLQSNSSFEKPQQIQQQVTNAPFINNNYAQPKKLPTRSYVYTFVTIAIALLVVGLHIARFNSENKTITYKPPAALASAESSFINDLANDSSSACSYINESEAVSGSPYISCQGDFAVWYKALSSEAKHIIADKVKPDWQLSKSANTHGMVGPSEITVNYGPYKDTSNNNDRSPAILLDNFIGGQVWTKTGPDNSWQVGL